MVGVNYIPPSQPGINTLSASVRSHQFPEIQTLTLKQAKFNKFLKSQTHFPTATMKYFVFLLIAVTVVAMAWAEDAQQEGETLETAQQYYGGYGGRGGYGRGYGGYGGYGGGYGRGYGNYGGYGNRGYGGYGNRGYGGYGGRGYGGYGGYYGR